MALEKDCFWNLQLSLAYMKACIPFFQHTVHVTGQIWDTHPSIPPLLHPPESIQSPRRWKQYVPPKYWVMQFPHSVRTLMTTFNITTAMETLRLIQTVLLYYPWWRFTRICRVCYSPEVWLLSWLWLSLTTPVMNRRSSPSQPAQSWQLQQNCTLGWNQHGKPSGK